MPDRQLSFPNCFNVRDLGGLPTARGATTRWQAFVRADSPYRLTHDSQHALLDYGVRTVIDLRSDIELEEEPNPFRADERVTYHHVSIIDPRDAERLSAAIREQGMLAWNRLMLDIASGTIGRVMQAIAAAPDGGVMFHCYAGKDRTGLMAMLLLSLAGVSDEDVASDYAESNQYLDALNTRTLARFPDEIKPRVRANLLSGHDNMCQILDHLHARYGDARQYLLSAGLSAVEIERILKRLVSSRGLP